MLFKHFAKQHYRNRRNPHGDINIMYAILQELVVWEVNTRGTRGRIHTAETEKRQSVGEMAFEDRQRCRYTQCSGRQQQEEMDFSI
jgi:hypothetical protein